jgi:hypothetical protein
MERRADGPTGRRSARGRRSGALLLAGLLLAAGCAHDYGLENLEVPVHVWLRAPRVAVAGGSLDALIYVDSQKAWEGPVEIPRGATHVELPSVYVPVGDRRVSAVIGGGAASATDEVSIEGESWIVVTADGSRVSIAAEDRQPGP